ncbi:hypothetical protein KPH14_006975 [Odynerus spinipes]|uniref:PBZ-type domain-containing protein n=1 Tax=Odynerus spinipes TaxID=1348599 RepID=A0AAD9VRV7_9HYME|nr:hypothetical protein KPH14_006975 [Odynerus spinipes]
MNHTTVTVRKKCPFMEKCYRKNPIHFTEMSHPHLEKLVITQLDSTIRVPDVVDFDCDRSQLLDQLKVLQIVMKKERDKNRDSFLELTKDLLSDNITVIPATSGSQNHTTSDMQHKVERHKKAMAMKRENKLKEMDTQAEMLAKSSKMSDENDSGSSSSTTQEPEIIITGEKRNRESNTSITTTKKTKGNGKDAESEGKESQCQDSSSCYESQQSSGSSKGTSIMDAYVSCKSDKSRDEMRKKAIHMMKQQGFKVSPVEPGEFALKYALSAPYHLFFTRVENSHATYDQSLSITFPEILDRSLGDIVHSLQINFMVDVGWLCLQYVLAGQPANIMILYGERVDEEKLGSNITMIPVTMPTKFGCHHTKIMILKYKNDGIRVVVSTANLYSDDWENRTQGLWISPHLPPLPQSANTTEGESKTGFKKDLLRYLNAYKNPALTEWISTVRRTDFSDVNVFFVASVPGGHKNADTDLWGHRKLADVLSAHATLPPDAPYWPIIAQSSSIGSLGPNYESWLSKNIVPAMSMETTKGVKSSPNFHFIFPTIKNYKEGFDCRTASCCLCYSLQMHSKQKWFQSYMHQWKASKIARDKAMPHIKSYTRLSPDFKKMAWFVLTSANLSKAAWGTYKNSNYIMSYEGGVIFVPKFITGKTTFPIGDEDESGDKPFPIPYDLPLTRYGSDDKPFVSEFFEGYE